MAPSSVALVTGGGIRVGAAIVRALVAAGTDVWVHYHRSAGPAQALGDELSARGHGGKVLGLVQADLGQADDRAQLCATILAPDGPAAGRLDALVNNAASFEHGKFLDRDDEDLARVLALNLIAPLSLARRLAPALGRHKGAMVNIVDVAGLHPLRGYLDHSVAKAGLEMATRALAVELAPIRVNAVAPGTVAWPTDPRYAPGSPARAAIEGQIPLGHIGSPEDVAQAVCFFLDAPHVTGQCLAVDGGRVAALGAQRL